MTPLAVLYQRFLECTGVCTDTRAIEAGSLFVALKGPRFDANAFAAQALASGARYAIVDDPGAAVDPRCLLVHDGLAALQDLARHHRRQFELPVLAITGTNGKTTTKELVQAVMAGDRPTLATKGNLNNHIGVPLTLLRLTAGHRFAIIEMGANKPGDIAELVGIAEPTHGLITNVGRAHLEGFGGFDGVLRTKTELYAFLASHAGSLLVNADDEVLMTRSQGLPRHTYGTRPDADTRGRDASQGPFLGLAFLGRDGREHRVATRLVGAYNLPNALAAVAVGRLFGVPDATIVSALEGYVPSNNRSQFSDTGRNEVVVDAYNANPSSMGAALRHFAAMASARPKLVILGDMLELGADSRAEHRKIIELISQLGLEAWYVGPLFAEAGSSGTTYANAEAVVARLNSEPVEGRLILLKGSRGIRLEALLPAL
jgi:UDP-N-acetylmuramoyl-tripeptide--D-alanyl-D-alanine ligase